MSVNESDRTAFAAPAPAIGIGIALTLLAMTFFAGQDAVTKVLGREYAVPQFLMVRYWFFAVFVVGLIVVRKGWSGLRSAALARRPVLQSGRALLLVCEIGIFASALGYLGLAEIHAIFATAPLIATALAGPLLGEDVGWRRWTAVMVGFAGALVIIRPGYGIMSIGTVLALIGALAWATYNLLTRLTSQSDAFETNMLYPAVIGALAITPLGIWHWTPPTATAAGLMLALSISAVCGHTLLMRALASAPAAVLQPFNYTLLVAATVIGYLVFGEIPDGPTVVGALIVVGSGLFVAWREHQRGLKNRSVRPPAHVSFNPQNAVPPAAEGATDHLRTSASRSE